jgi:hypothetical protein
MNRMGNAEASMPPIWLHCTLSVPFSLFGRAFP